MNNQEVLDTIIKYGLSVRQIPTQVRSLFTMDHYNPLEHTIFEEKIIVPNSYMYWKKQDPLYANKHVRFDDDKQIVYRKYACEIKVPTHAGYWMCKQVKDTSSKVQWNIKTDHLAPTLSQSIILFLSNKPI